jgi:hypothetical protein
MSTIATLDHGLEIRRTSLPDTTSDNRGLFATRSFQNNEVVTEYTGARISREEAMKRRQRNMSSHIKTVSYHELIDGDTNPVPGQGIAQFTNDGTNVGAGNNTRFVYRFDHNQSRTKVFLQASRLIESGEEIFVSYGKGYWGLQQPVYTGLLTTSLIVDIKVRMRSLYQEYHQLYQDESEDKSDHYEIDFIVDASFDADNQLHFIVRWNTVDYEVATIDAVDICHNVDLLKEFYEFVDPTGQAVLLPEVVVAPPPPPRRTEPPSGVKDLDKVCSRCMVRKSTDTHFRKDRNRRGGYRGQCKTCEKVVEGNK